MREYASPPCYLHELEPIGWDEVRAWRKRTRDRLIAERLSWSVRERNARGAEAKRRLVQQVDIGAHAVLGIYWPMRGEIDVRDIARRHIDAGGQVGVPVVVERKAPVEFWQWKPGMRMQRGLWDIPIPRERCVLVPDALIVPLVGFDGRRYRLGYGGGYYDRTLASAAKKPFCVGLGYVAAGLPTIYPQPHDIPMDAIVTDGAEFGRGDIATSPR
jgi:5-formyltetrahydrofolate cyclo-ligase